MINRTVIAAAALLLSAAAADGACLGDAQLAMATVTQAGAAELKPAQIPRLRKLYVGLRKSAYDRCTSRDDSGPMAAKERCFRETLSRLVADLGDPSLARYHAYIDGIERPSG